MWFLHGAHGRINSGIDDANIFFVYAENWIAGHGPTYGGQHEWVEGFSSPLWMMLCTLCFGVGGNEFLVLLLTSGLWVGTLFLLMDLICRSVSIPQNRWWGMGLGFLLVWANPSAWLWNSITLMDTSLWTFSLTAFLYVLMLRKSMWLISLTAALLVWVRPEALLIAPCGLVLSALTPSDCSVTDRIRSVWRPAVAVLISMTLLIGIRLRLYGYPLPNTFYAKISPDLSYRLHEGLQYFLDFLQSSWVYPVELLGLFGVLLGLLSSLRAKSLRVWDPGWVVLAGMTGLLLAVPIWNGGDHFAEFRFYQPAIPSLALCGVLGVEWLSNRLPTVYKRMGIVLLTGLLLNSGLQHWHSVRRSGSSLNIEFQIAREQRQNGERLRALLRGADPLPTAGVVIAGALAREYPGPVMDLMGLNNIQIAHHKGLRYGLKNHAAFERELFFTDEPGLLLLNPRHPFFYGPLDGLLTDPRFCERWRYGLLWRSAEMADSVELFIRRDVVADVLAGGDLQFTDTLTWQGRWKPPAS